MVPMFTSGIPSSVTMSIMMGAFLVHGLTPGLLLFRDHPEVAWPIIASLAVGNVMLLIMNVPLIRVWLDPAGFLFHSFRRRRGPDDPGVPSWSPEFR